MSDEYRRTHSYFTSANARNENGRFHFQFREPIFYVASIKLKKVIIPNFVGIVNSPYYFIRTDCISLTRDTPSINGVPSQIAAVIPNVPNSPGQAIHILEDDSSEAYNLTHMLQNLWFELLDYQGNLINPPDLNWSFCVELQIVIKNI